MSCDVNADAVDLQTISLSRGQILAKLSTLDVNKGAGPDSIPPSILLSCCNSFVEL